jgi:hypothetical protein
MGNSTTATRSAKPHPDFPLTPRGDGRWCKKVKGKLHYFTGTAQEAADEWLRVKDFILAGRTPPPKGHQAVTVKLLVDSFLTWKEQLRDSGEIAPRTFDRYYATGLMLAEFFGRQLPVDHLTTADFQSLRASMAKRWGPVALGNEIQTVRSIFGYGYKQKIIDTPAPFGITFEKPSAKTLRLQRNKSGPTDFTPEQRRWRSHRRTWRP